MSLRTAIAACSLPAAVLAAPGALAQEVVEEVVVTGSFIRGTPQDAALPVDLLSQEDLIDNGSPTITEMIRNLNISNGNLGETNQFDNSGGQGNEGVATINLRGLGSARSLVLINGRRHVASPTIGVDISAIPSIAIGRLEVLKDGAAALYGSDAVAGVANFITRENYRGLEFRAGGQDLEGSDGEYQFGVIGGMDVTENISAMAAFEYERRSELTLPDAGLVRPFAENIQGGYSTIGQPGRIFPVNATGLDLANISADPECANFGNTLDGSTCRFQFTQFDNLVEEQDTYKFFSEVNVDLSENVSWHLEGLYSYVDIPSWKTSPSYPPQSLFGPDRLIPVVGPNAHPGLVDFANKYPGVIPADAQAVYTITRHAGAGGFQGQPREGQRESDTFRIATALKGTLFEERLGFNIDLAYSSRERTTSTPDMFVERLAFALDGLGGPNCDPATGTPGVGDCMYHTPTSNGFANSVLNGYQNPNADPDLAAMNLALQPWLEQTFETTTTDELLVFDATFDGTLPIELAGGTVGWAAGIQSRNEKFELDPNDTADITVSPCPFNDPASVTLGNTDILDCTQSVLTGRTGPGAFLSGTEPQDTERTIYGAFVELGLPITEKLNMQLAGRFEDYGGDVGSTFDPKVAVRFQATDTLILRGSVSSTFRGPPQPFLQGVGTSLSFVPATNAFKAVDTVGNPNLSSEEAIASNFGIIYENENFFGSLDWWRFDFEGPIQLEDFLGIVTQYSAQGCEPGGAGVGTDTCNALADRITFQPGLPTSVGNLSRIERTYTNGGDILTQGIDWFAQYDFTTDFGEWSVGTQGTYTHEYDSDDFTTDFGLDLSPGGDFAGELNNDRQPITPIVDLQGNVFLKFTRNNHRATLTARYWGEYEDESASSPGRDLSTIDDMLTVDLNYNVTLFEDSTTLNLTVFNLFDEDPPLTQTDLNYDAYTHSPFGRIMKVSLIYQL
jgi:outer membrane receptor for ferrienterochelin and colicin